MSLEMAMLDMSWMPLLLICQTCVMLANEMCMNEPEMLIELQDLTHTGPRQMLLWQ
jgi:hypothetical protein